jgi:hypothetical protein
MGHEEEAAFRLREASRSPEEVGRMVDFISEHFVFGQPINLAIGLCEAGYRMPYYEAWMRARSDLSSFLYYSIIDDWNSLHTCKQFKGTGARYLFSLLSVPVVRPINC